MFSLRVTGRLAAIIFFLLPVTTFAVDARPNFVVVLCDDLGYGDLACFGHPKIKTARLDRMAKEGVRFSNFYSSAPVCSPSRVGLMTGRSPNRAGVFDWIPPAGTGKRDDNRDLVHMRREEPTIANLLKKAGYATCMSGKWHCNSRFNNAAQPQPGDAGFDHWFATQNNASPSHLNPKNFVRNGTPVGPLRGSSCQLVVDEAIDWLEKQQKATPDQPFFIYVAYHEPHEPVASPDALVKKYLAVSKNRNQAEYFANVHNLDAATGRLLDSLDRLGVEKNTLVVFSSDNGPETLNRYGGAGRSYGTPAPLRGMKLWTTEAGFRVSGIARWPGTIPAGKVSSEVVSALDLLPTFCSLAGVKLPTGRTFDGTNCTAALKGGSLVREKPLIWCYYNAINERRVAMREGDWKVLARLVDGDGKALKSLQNLHPGNAANVKSAKLADVQIFKVVDDIAEKTDLATSQPDEAKRLRAKLETAYAQLVENSLVWER